MIKKIKDRLLGRENSAQVGGSATQTLIVMYSTRYCPYCMRARTLLQSKGWDYQDISVDGSPELRKEMIERSGRHTVPQIWIGDQHIGGCDELFRLEGGRQLDGMVMGESK